MEQFSRIAKMLLCAITFVFCVEANGQIALQAKVPAYGIDPKSATFTIVRAELVKELKGSHAKFVEPNPEKYRGVVITVKIADPPSEFVLRNKDFTLHYQWGRNARSVAPCAGLSACSAQLHEERQIMLCTPNMNLSREFEPREKECYIDLFFTEVEASVRQIKLHYLAMPVAPPVHLPLQSGASLDGRSEKNNRDRPHFYSNCRMKSRKERFIGPLDATA